MKTMKRLFSATPALYCLTNLIYPVSIRIAKSTGQDITAINTCVWFPTITGISIVLACIWFCYSFNSAERVNGLHSLFGILSPTLAAVNGICFMLTDCCFIPCICAIAMWLASLLIPAGCNDRRLGRHFRGVLMLVPGVCVLLFAGIFMLGCRLFP